MARRKQREGRGEQDTTRQASLEEALTATHQHTVPVLPATAPLANGAPPLAAGRRQTNSPRPTSYARTTLAPVPTPPRPTQGDPWRAHAPADSGEAGRSADLEAAAGAAESDKAAGEADEAARLPGRPTIALPALTDAQLPALRPDTENRQLAVREEAAPVAVLIRGARRPRHPALPVVPRRRGKRPAAVQFIVGMVAAMTLLTALTLSTPIGQSALFTNGFQAYANAIPWIPTPTPTPRPTPVPVYYAPPGSSPGTQAIINEIAAVFGPYAQGAINVARCESGFNPNAVNPYAIGNSHASGVFQILYPSTWNTTSYASSSPFDANANIHAAYQIFSRDGHRWSEWVCQP